jgi:uncharacterized phage protein (TIGR01671 family)
MEIKIRYVVKDPVGKITMKSFMLKEVEDGLLNYWLAGFQDSDIKIISRDLFTGKQDCTRTKEFPNGKEIYSGDIVKSEYRNWILKIEIGEAKYLGIGVNIIGVIAHSCNDSNKRSEPWMHDSGVYDWEIIGNRHQNPELCKE